MSDEWETPRTEIIKACNILQIPYPAFDAACNSKNCKCANRPSVNALKFIWFQNFFLNPPFSDIDTWLTHAKICVRENELIGLCLLPMKPDQKWFSKHIGEHFEKDRKSVV